MSYKILIVEDDPIIAADIEEIIIEAGYTCMGIAFSATDALEIIAQATTPDLVLCDISIQGKLSGIELIEQLKLTMSFPVIYISSYSDSHTMKLVKQTLPVGYIVKPIQPKTLISTIEIGMLNAPPPKDLQSDFAADFLFIKDKGTFIKVSYRDIIYAAAFDNYTYIYTNNEKYLVPITLKEVESKLQKQNFCRIHRSYLINPNHIKSIEGSFLALEKITLPIGKKYKTELLSKFNLM